MSTSDNVREYDAQLTAEAVVRGLLAQVKTDMSVKTTTGEEEVSTLKEIKGILKKLDDKLTEKLDKSNEHLKNIADFFANHRNRQQTTPAAGTPSSAPTVAAAAAGNIPPSRRSGVLTRPTVATAATGNMPPSRRDGQPPGQPPVTVPAAAGNVPPGQPDSFGGGPTAAISSASKALMALNVSMLAVSRGSSAVLNDFGIGISSIFRGVIKDSVTWKVNQAALAFQLEGTAAGLSGVKKQYMDIENIAAETGFNEAVVQEQYNRLLQKGTTLEMKDGKVARRNLQDQKGLLKNSMTTANMLGADVSQTVDMFSEWNTHLGLTNNQLAQVGRSMQSISHTTGVTGNQLLDASKQAAQIAKEVYRFSGISERGMANLVQQSTLMQKYGFQETGGKIQAALAGGPMSLSAASPQIASWITRGAGRAGMSTMDVQNNVLGSPAASARLFQGMGDEVSAALQRMGMSGQLSQLTQELQRMERTDPTRAMNIKTILSLSYGGAGEVERLGKFNEENSKTVEQRIAELQTRITGATGPGAETVRQQAQMQIQQLQTGQRRETLSGFQTELQNAGGDVNRALEAFNQARMTEVERGGGNQVAQEAARMGMGQLQGMAGQAVQDLQSRAEAIKFDLAGKLREKGVSGTQELAEGLTGPNAANLNAVLQDLENQISTNERRGTDPILKTQGMISDINSELKRFVSFILGNLGFPGLMAILGGSAALGVASKVGLMSSGGSLLKFLPSLLGGGATAAAAAPVLTALPAAGAAAGAGAGASALGAAVPVAAGATIGTGGTILIAAAAAASLLAWTGALVGGFRAGAKAAEVFGVKQKELTLRQQMAAEGAGTLTGALNFLTFGLFSSALGPTGTLTKKLAKFFHELFPLAIVFSSLITAAKVVWGILKGLWVFVVEVFKGVYDGFMTALEPIIQLGKDIWKEMEGPLKDLLSVFMPANEVMADSVDIVGSIVKVFRWLGVMVGGMFRDLGQKVAAFVRYIAPKVIEWYQNIAEMIRKITPVVKYLWEATQIFFGGLWQVLEGIFDLDFDKIGKGLEDMYLKAWPKLVGGFLLLMSIVLPYVRKGLLKLGLWLLDEFQKFSWRVLMWLIGLPGQIMTLFYNIFVTFPTWLRGKIYEALDNIWQDLSKGEGLSGFISNMWEKLVELVGNWWAELKKGVVDFGTDFWAKLRNKMDEVFQGVINAMVKKFPALANAMNIRATDAPPQQSGWMDFGARFFDPGDLLSRIPRFASGTQQVTQEGLGYLHKDEAVIPADLWNRLQSFIASGNSFESGSAADLPVSRPNYLSEVLNDLKTTIKNMDGVQGPNVISNLVESCLKKLTDMSKTLTAKPATLTEIHGEEPASSPNIFDWLKQMVQPANDISAPGTFDWLKQMVQPANNVPPQEASSFDKVFEAVTGSTLNGFFRQVASVLPDFGQIGDNLGGLFVPQKKQAARGEASTSGGMYYDMGGIISSLSSAFTSATKATNKGEVNTSFVSPEDAEEYIAAHVENSRPQGTALMVPGMEGILNYLTGQGEDKQDKILSALLAMKDLLQRSSPSEVLLPDNSSGMPAGGASGIKNWAKGRITGQWAGDQDGVYQEQANNTGDFNG